MTSEGWRGPGLYPGVGWHWAFRLRARTGRDRCIHSRVRSSWHWHWQSASPGSSLLKVSCHPAPKPAPPPRLLVGISRPWWPTDPPGPAASTPSSPAPRSIPASGLPITTAASGYTSGAVACFENSPNNISVGNGYLSLTARKEATPFTCADPYGSFATQYTSGTVSTYGLFTQTYGRFDVRAKIPAATVAGLQSSLWLDPQNTDGITAELDIAEMYSEYPTLAIPTLHYNYDPGTVNASTNTNITTNYACTIDPNVFNDYVDRVDSDVHHHALQRTDLPGGSLDPVLAPGGTSTLQPTVLHQPDPGPRRLHQQLRPGDDSAAGHHRGPVRAGLEPRGRAARPPRPRRQPRRPRPPRPNRPPPRRRPGRLRRYARPRPGIRADKRPRLPPPGRRAGVRATGLSMPVATSPPSATLPISAVSTAGWRLR